MAGWLTYRLRCGECGHRWVPRKLTWKNPKVKCPVCGMRAEMPVRYRSGFGCLVILAAAAAVAAGAAGTMIISAAAIAAQPAAVENPGEATQP